MTAIRVLTATTTSVDATRDLAARVAELAQAGDVVLLSGELGAGKTAFVQGFARGLGVAEPVTSPTFMLVAEHAGRGLRLLHADVYRLDSLDEILDLGLDQLVDDAGPSEPKWSGSDTRIRGSVLVVEWGERAAAALPGERLEVAIEVGEADDDRTFRFEATGPTWAARFAALGDAVHGRARAAG